MRVPATVPSFSPDDIDFIISRFSDILGGKSFLSMGKYGEEFEKLFATYTGTEYAVACNNGTTALQLIFRAIGVEGREVIVPSNTFIATALAVLSAGGTPVFADCCEDMCLDPEDVVKRITSRTAAIAHVHIGGLVSESVLKLKEMCEEHSIHLVEDAAQAHGSALDGQKAGTFGTAAGFSFFSTKVMTTGEGGMVTTDNAALVEQMNSLREFGKVRKGVYVNYHESLGYNGRMPEVSALMGIRQLKALDTFIHRRREITDFYDSQLGAVDDVVLIRPKTRSAHNGFKYIILLPHHDREKVHMELQKVGVSASGYVYEVPLHKLPVFPESNILELPMTEKVCRQHMCLPVFFGMNDEQAEHVVSSLKVILADGRNRLP